MSKQAQTTFHPFFVPRIVEEYAKSVYSVNEKLVSNSNFLSKCLKDSGERPALSTLTESGEKVKDYVLRERTPLNLGFVPRYENDPFTGAVNFRWQKVETPYHQQFNEGGFLSGKLFRCGLSWRHVTYFDEHRNPVSFPYGYTMDTAPERDIDDPLEQRVKEIEAKYWLKANGFQVPDDTDDPAPTKTPQEPSHHAPEFLEKERERDTARRKRAQKNACKDLVNKNYLNYMYTLTFALELNPHVYGLRFILEEEEQRKREAVEKVWNARRTAIRKTLKDLQIDFKYVKVLEPHDSAKTDERKRGTYHIHLATDRPVDKDLLQYLWGYGVVWVDDFNKSKTTDDTGRAVNVERDGCVLSPGDYMAKYMEKDFDDIADTNKRAYSPSKNLKHVVPDKDTAARERYLQNPISGFSVTDKIRINQIEPGLFAKIEALNSIDDVKVFDRWCQTEFQRKDRETGEYEPAKLWIHYEYYNFRLLMKNARSRRTGEHREGGGSSGRGTHGRTARH